MSTASMDNFAIYRSSSSDGGPSSSSDGGGSSGNGGGSHTAGGKSAAPAGESGSDRAGPALPPPRRGGRRRPKGVSQSEIATILGLHRTTVTKILNQSPEHGIHPETVKLVMDKARELGYDFTRLRNIHRRRSERHPVDLTCSVAIIMENGVLFDRGTAEVSNLSHHGMLLTKLKFPKNCLPLEPFNLHVVFRDGELRGVQIEADLVRFDPHGTLHVGINIVDIAEDDRQLIIEYLRGKSRPPARAKTART